MKRIIHHLRKQSEKDRRHILHVLTVIFAIILFSLWVYSLGAGADNPKQVKIQNETQPFNAIKDNIVGGYQNILKPN